MFDQINERLELNLVRVKNLGAIYDNHLKKPGKGRRKVSETDVLRAAVVLLHASLEDFLRSLLIWKLPQAGSERLDQIPILSPDQKKNATKFLLGELAHHRGLSVNELIDRSVASYLESYQSFNNVGDVVGALKDCGLNADGANHAKLEEMIKRRHNIVHKADRNPVQGKQGQHKVQSMTPKQLQEYLEAVSHLRAIVQGQLV